MGINGLLQALKPISKQAHVRQYQGQRVAVDGYSWLHKGAYCCARELCEGIWTDKYVSYFMSRVQLLRTHGVEPIIVFDGGRLPIKGEEEETRHRARAEARAKAAAHLAAGNVAIALECYQRCVDITPAMAKQVIEELKSQGVAFLVAPYEADAQMAYLARSGQVQLVVTEDSDLLAYGCPRVLYKLDKTGTGEEVALADLPNCPGLPLSGWTSDQFLQLCVMAGCDFLVQLPGIGLKKAHGVLRKYRSFTKVVKMLRFNGTKVPADYEARFQLALWAFRHARVYCTTEKALVHLSPLPGGGIGTADVDVPAAVTQLEQQQQDQKLDFLGPVLPPEVAKGIAEGDLDPNTHQPYDLAAIYSGCSRPPAHLIALLRPAAAADDGAQPYGSSSQGMAAFSSGAAAAAGKPRVGLSKRHAGQSSGRRLSGAAAASGGARSGGGRPATAASGGSRKRSSLGIARYFQTPAAAGPSSQTGRDAAATQPHLAAAAPGDNAFAPQGGIQRSIAQAMSTLGQQLQQRQQQQQEEKQQLLQQLTSQRQHQQQEEQQFGAARQQPSSVLGLDGAAADGAFCLPPAKRHRSSGDVDPDAAAAAVGAADIDGFAAAGAQDLSLPIPSLQRSTAGEDLSVGAGADDASMSLGLGSSAALAEGSSSGAELGASQQGGGLLLDSPSILCSSGGDALQAVCGARRSRGAAVSALSALFTGTTAGFGAALGDSIDPGTGHAWGSSQPLLGSVEAGPDAWELPMNGSTAGGVTSQAADLDSIGLLGNGSDTGGSLDGCGSSSGLSFGQLGTSSAALPDGTASVSFDQADGAAVDGDAAAVGSVGGCSSSFKRFKQCLRAGTSQGQQLPPQQQETPMELTRSSFFSQQQQPRTARRHSRFREQLLRSTADLLTTDSPDAAAADGFDMLHDDQQQQPEALALPRNHAAMCNAGAVLSGTQARQQQRLSVHVSDSSEPSSGSGSISNDENADTAADAAGLEHLGITHIRKYAKLAHKVVKTVAKQQLQQQQHAPLAPRPGVLNTQPQSAAQQLKQAPGQLDSTATAADGLGGSAAAPAHRMRLQLGLSRGGLLSGRKGPKAKGAAAGTGSFAAKLAGLRYDASMFVPLEQGAEEEEEEEGVLAAAAAEEVPEVCVRGSTAAAAARKPFKAPWLPGAATGCPSSSDDDLRVTDATAAPTDRPGKRDRTAAVGFGAFADFACDDDSAGGVTRRGVVQKRGAAFTWR